MQQKSGVSHPTQGLGWEPSFRPSMPRLAVDQTAVTLLRLSPPSLLRHLLKAEGGAAEWQGSRPPASPGRISELGSTVSIPRKLTAPLPCSQPSAVAAAPLTKMSLKRKKTRRWEAAAGTGGSSVGLKGGVLQHYYTQYYHTQCYHTPSAPAPDGRRPSRPRARTCGGPGAQTHGDTSQRVAAAAAMSRLESPRAQNPPPTRLDELETPRELQLVPDLVNHQPPR